jgi:pyruvate dehydrogenase E1 component alpha subunit
VVEHGFDEDELNAIRDEVIAEVDEAARRALEQPMPDPGTATDGVFADAWEPLGDGHAPWSHWRDTTSANGNGSAS